MPTYGWQILFLIGGIVPIVIGLAAIFGLPKSIKYMALHESQRSRMEALIAAIRPGFKVPANARFVIEDEKQFPGFNPVYLFREGLAVITPLLWLLFALNLMGYFFLLSWTPTLLTAAKLPPATGALAGAVLQVGGTVGALTLCGLLQRHRFFAIAIMFIVAVPVVGAIGFAGLDFASGAADGDVLRRLPGARHPVGHQRGRGDDLSDLVACKWFRMAVGDRADRLNRRPAGRSGLRRPAGADALYGRGRFRSLSGR